MTRPPARRRTGASVRGLAALAVVGRRTGVTVRVVAALAFVSLVAMVPLASCGRATMDPVDRAGRSLRDLRSGILELSFTATPAAGPPVGFEVSGPFSFEGVDGELVVAELENRQLLGDRTVATTLISTGDRAWVRSGPDLVPVEGAALEPLRLGTGRKPAGLDDLDLSAWVSTSRTDDGPSIRGEATRRIRGQLDVAAFLDDMSRLAQEAGGAAPAPVTSRRAPSSGQDEGLAKVTKSATIEILAARGDDAVRRIDAQVRFAGDPPPAVTQALGPYAAVDLRFRLRIEKPNATVKVAPPAAG